MRVEAANNIRPLRNTARAPEKEASRFTIEELKEGITIGSQKNNGLSSEIAPDHGSRQNLKDPKPVRRAADMRNSTLSEEEKIDKLKKIKKSSEEYEGLLMAELIKSMRQSPLAKVAGNDTYSEIAEKPFTQILTQAGGLGLSDKIVSQIASQEGLAEALSNNPEIMGPGWRMKMSANQFKKDPYQSRGKSSEEFDAAQMLLSAAQNNRKSNASNDDPIPGTRSAVAEDLLERKDELLKGSI